MSERFWSVAPLGATAAFFAVGVGLRIAIQVARTGSTGLALTANDWREHIGGGALVAASLAICAEAVIAARDPARLAPFAIRGLEGEGVRLAGLVIALVATALMFAAQLNLGRSWRIGIEQEARPGLVTGGFYSVSRNPIFAAVLLGLFGFVMLLPTWISVASLVAAAVAVRIQIGAEEAWLATAYGEAYASYSKRVGRFVPWLGRRS